MKITIRQDEGLVETTAEELALKIKKKGKSTVTINTVKFLMKCVHIICQECHDRRAVILFKKNNKTLCTQCYNKVRFNK